MTGPAERSAGSGRSSRKPQRRWPRARRERERAWLEELYETHHDPRFIDPDPLQFVRRLPCPADREVVGLVASALAYGNVTAMIPAISTVLDVLGPRPAAGVESMTDADLAARLADFRYRVTPGERVAGLLVAVRRVRRARGSLEDCVLAADDGSSTLVPAVAGFVAEMRRASPTRLDHLLPDPRDGSACKRLMLWLRWMVRCDAVDPGGWDRLEPARLVMPIDTHVYRTARERRWTRRRTINLATALEITERLGELEPEDPLRWDFAITRPGIRGDDG